MESSATSTQEDDAMVTTVTPSMTDGQIDKAVSHYRDALKRSRNEIGASDEVQYVLGSKEYIEEIVGVLRRRVKVFSNMIHLPVSVNLALIGKEALVATGRFVYSNNEVVATMPNGEKEEEVVYLFKPEAWEYTMPGYMSDVDLEKCFDRRGLKPVDPHTLAAYNQANPAFADTHPNATHWQVENGRWCYAAFDRWDDGRRVNVRRDGDGWHVYWWFAGVRNK